MAGTQSTSRRYAYMDVIRIIGCLLVICLHMATLNIDMSVFSATSAEWNVMNFMESLGVSGVAFFYMLSGALFLRKEADSSLKHIWKKIGILFLVYIVTLFCYNIRPFVKGWEPWEAYYLKLDLVDNVLYGKGIYHLGFLPHLMVMYAMVPFMKDAFASKKNCEYFIVLFVIFSTIIEFALKFQIPAKGYVQSFQDRFAPTWVLGNIGYFVLGHYLHEYGKKLSRKQSVLAVLATVGAVIFTMVCNHLDAIKTNTFSIIANTPLSVAGFLFLTGIYLLVKSAMSDYNSEKGIKVLRYLSSLTLGIYLVHPLVMAELVPLIPWEAVLGNYVLLVMVRFVFVIIVSALIAAILKKIPVIKKVL